eukprot:Skav228901  [mRNA]  locus=scaffold194:505919:506287:+ [translate_table: standard]
MAPAFRRLMQATSKMPSEKSKNNHPHRDVLCLAQKHAKELDFFIRAVEDNMDGFKDAIQQIREDWQAQLDREDEVLKGIQMFEQTEPPDYCLPLNGLQRSTACPFFRHKCGIVQPDRCMVSL